MPFSCSAFFFFSSRRRHTRCALVTGVQTCALPISALAIVKAVTQAPRNRSKMTLADLAAYQAKERPAVCTTYRVYKVCGMAPPSSGATTVFGILGMLEAYDMKAMGKDNVMSWQDRKSTRLNSSH